MKTLLIYSSLTGNTKLVSEKVYEVIGGEKKIIDIKNLDKEEIENFENIIIAFWCDKGTVNSDTKELFDYIKNKNVLFLGTLGAAPDSEHGVSVYENATKLCNENNRCLGGILVRGKIDEKLVEKMKSGPLSKIHPLTPERLERIKMASTHPDEEDFKTVQEFFKSKLS